MDVGDGEHGIKDQPDVLARESLFLLGGEGFVEDICVDVAEFVVPGHPAVIEVEGDDLVEVLGGEGEDLLECDGLESEGFDDDAVEVEDEGGEHSSHFFRLFIYGFPVCLGIDVS